MKSLQKLPLSSEALLFPALTGIALFSSKERIPDQFLSVGFSWLAFFCACSIFVRNVIVTQFATALCLVALSLRVLGALTQAQVIVPLYNASFAVIITFAGAHLFSRHGQRFYNQLTYFAAASLIVALCQIFGVEFFQNLGSAVDWKIATAEPVLFVPYDNLGNIGLTQQRPDGFTHANNLTSQMLVACYAICFAGFVSPRKGVVVTSRSLFVISIACALNAGKIVLASILALWVTALLVKGGVDRRLLRTVAITSFAYAIYAFLFPGLFVTNFNAELFLFNAAGRIANLSEVSNLEIFDALSPALVDRVNGEYVPLEALALAPTMETDGSLQIVSGLAGLVKHLPIVLILLLLIGMLWRKNVKRWTGHVISSHSRFVGVSLAVSILGGPFYRTVWFAFFASVALSPILLSWSAGRDYAALSSAES